MKKLHKMILFILCLSVTAHAADKVAAVIKVKGNVRVKSVEDRIYKNSYVGQILYDGDWLKTDSDEFAAIVFMDGSQLKIRELTELEIRSQAISRTVINTDLYLTEGEVWTKVQKQKGDFKIQTPVSVASVKGTEFDMLFDKIDHVSDLFVISGSVEFSNELGTILAKEMTLSRIVPEEKPQRVAKLKKSDIPEWKDAIEPDWGFNIVPEKQGKLPVGQSVNITVQIRDLSHDKKANQYTGHVSIESDSPSLKVGQPGGNFKTKTDISISKGSGSFAVQGLNSGEFACLIAMPEGESRKVLFEFEKTAEQKKKTEKKIEKLGKHEKIGKISEISERHTLETAKVSGATESADEVLNKVDKGEYEILDMIQVENSDGTISLKIIVEPK
jgi:hypothetical protein